MNTKNNRVIIVTPGGSIFRDPHVRAFKELGFECAVFNCRNGLAYNQIFRAIARRIPLLGYVKKIKIVSINNGLIKLVKRYNPRYLFVQKGENISPATLETIKGLGVVTINFYNDFEWQVIKEIAPHYDYFFTQHRVILERLWKELNLKNCFHMHHAAEPLVDPFTNRQNKYNISFVGTFNSQLYPNREKYLMAVKDFGLHVWGTSNWLDTPLKDCFHGRANGDERLDIYRKSKIVIDINWEHFVSDGISARPFEVAASGTCLFADLVKWDIHDAYEENQEFVSFSSAEELRDKVKYYLAHNKEREEIARAGYNKTVLQHTYLARMRQLFDTMKCQEKYLYK